MYDKKEDRIKKYNSSESIFFEWDRNTVDKEIISNTTALEDLHYKAIDNDSAPIIVEMRDGKSNPDLLRRSNIVMLNAFITALFCRIPKFDLTLDDLIDRGTITIVDADDNVITDPLILAKYTNNASFKKVQRLNLIGAILERNAESGKGKGGMYRLQSFSDDQLLLGDYPLIYKNDPLALGNMLSQDVILPLSSKRLYMKIDKEIEFTLSVMVDISAITIDQAVRYVCGANEDFLSKCVKYFQYVKPLGLVEHARSKLFAA